MNNQNKYQCQICMRKVQYHYDSPAYMCSYCYKNNIESNDEYISKQIYKKQKKQEREE